jgi:DNA-directed RNA polymerase specialized sigma24 family protein
MPNSASSLQEKALTVAQFEVLLTRLGTDRNHAGIRYEEIRGKLIRFFDYHSCRDSEQLADETFDRAIEKLALDTVRIQDVGAFLWGIARNIKQEALRKSARTIYLSDLANAETLCAKHSAAHGSRVEPIENSQSLRLLYRSLQCLSTKDRRLLLEYYSPRRDRVIARRQLAQEHGITVRALRLRVTRLKFKLKLHIGEHLAYIEVGPKD